MNPIFDIDILKSHVYRMDRKLFQKKWLRKEKTKLYKNLPKQWYEDMEYICKQYNTVITKLDLRNVACYCGPSDTIVTYYDHLFANCIDLPGDYAEPLVSKKMILSARMVLKIFFHELSHHIQAIVATSIANKKPLKYLYRNRLKKELTAERLAYYIAKTYSPHLKFQAQEFNAYKQKNSRDWLRLYHRL